MADRAYLTGERPDGSFKWCMFPCQWRDENGNRVERECGVPIDPQWAHGDRWTATGPPDAPTLTPSVNCRGGKCWHGFIINGDVRP